MAQRATAQQSECLTLPESAAAVDMPVPAWREKLRAWERNGDCPFPILRISSRTTRIPRQPFFRWVRGESAESK